MSDFLENSSKFLSSASLENRDSFASNLEIDGGDEEFYEKIEAPKFVDFTVPDHYNPDDRFWFCFRVGCDQKHEEEMDSEEIYKNFVLRVMAARSPNVRLRKALEKKCSKTPIKCPLSAPPKSTKPRLSRMAIISSISKKMVDEKKKVAKPLLKSGSTPLTKTKPVAAKYLTTPRNKKITSDQNSFWSVRNLKPVNVEVEKARVVAKALVFHSPKKAIKVKTSAELRTPISKLCQGLNKLEISSQRKRALGYSSKSSKKLSSDSSRRQLSSRKVQRKDEESHSSQLRNNEEAKSGRSVKTKIKDQLSQQQTSKKLLEGDKTQNLTNNGSCDITHQLAKNVIEEIGLQEFHIEGCGSKVEPPPAHCLDLATHDESKTNVNSLDVEESIISRSQATNGEENNSNDRNENITSECLVDSGDHSSANNSFEGQRNGHEFMDSDDKENASAYGNRLHDNALKQHGRKISGSHNKYGQVHKKITEQAQHKTLKEGSSGPVTKFKKPKPTNPKPFRLRTDERGILKEANLERRTDSLTPQSENANLNTPGKSQRIQGNDIQKGSMVMGLKTPKEERSKAPAAAVTPETSKHKERKPTSSLHESNAMQRLEKFRKITSPLPKHSVKPQGAVSTKQEQIAYLVPGLKLEVIHENSPEVVSEPRRERKFTTNAPSIDDAAAHASRSSSRGRRPVTVTTEQNFHSTHVPRSCTKKLK